LKRKDKWAERAARVNESKRLGPHTNKRKDLFEFDLRFKFQIKRCLNIFKQLLNWFSK
jgi:hypothetical protein